MKVRRSHGLIITACIISNSLVACHCDQRDETTSSFAQPAARSMHEAWCVTGRVTDTEGRPMPGVKILAHCGEGTLRVTGRATTDDQGEYTLRFGPGMWFMDRDDPVHIQAATISPHKPGYFEQNLHRQGDLYMASLAPGPTDWEQWLRPEYSGQRFDPGQFVLPDRTHRVDFVMVPAAQVQGRLLDADGQPVPHVHIHLTGNELPPSSSVVAWAKTGDSGAFVMTEVPTKVYWFSVRDRGRSEIRTEEITFDRPGRYTVELARDPATPPKLTLHLASRP